MVVLDKVLTRIKTVGLKLKPSKCKFGYCELKILGKIVNKEGIKADPKVWRWFKIVRLLKR